MLADQSDNKLLPNFIKRAIDVQIERAMNEEFEKAKKRLDERKSEIIAGVILEVQKTIDMQMSGEKLIITVKNELRR